MNDLEVTGALCVHYTRACTHMHTAHLRCNVVDRENARIFSSRIPFLRPSTQCLATCNKGDRKGVLRTQGRSALWRNYEWNAGTAIFLAQKRRRPWQKFIILYLTAYCKDSTRAERKMCKIWMTISRFPQKCAHSLPHWLNTGKVN